MMVSNRIKGSSLAELMICLVCLTIIGGGVFGVSSTATEGMSSNSKLTDSQSKVSRGLEMLCRHLRAASMSTLTTVPPGFTTPQPLVDGVPMDNLSFQSYAFQSGQGGGLPVLGASFDIQTQPSPQDPANGLDDDGDGVVDEQDVVLQFPGLADDVALSGVSSFTIVSEGASLEFSVTAGGLFSNNAPFQVNGQRMVNIRND